jgi:hypothetical protein
MTPSSEDEFDLLHLRLEESFAVYDLLPEMFGQAEKNVINVEDGQIEYANTQTQKDT